MSAFMAPEPVSTPLVLYTTPVVSPLNVIAPDEIVSPFDPVIEPVTFSPLATVAAPRIAVVVDALPRFTPLVVVPPMLIAAALPLSMTNGVAATAGPVIEPPKMALPETASVLERVVAPDTPSVFERVVAAVTPRVPEMLVLPDAAATVNLAGEPI